MTVPRWIASLMGKRVSPGTQPSSMACFQLVERNGDEVEHNKKVMHQLDVSLSILDNLSFPGRLFNFLKSISQQRREKKKRQKERPAKYSRLSTLPDTDDDVDAVVSSVKTLTVTLGTVTDEGEGVVLEVLLELGKGPVRSLKDGLLGAGKVDGLDASL